LKLKLQKNIFVLSFLEHSSRVVTSTAMDENNKRLTFSRIASKFKQSGVKIEKIIRKCELVDVHKDGIIHVDDLEDIIQTGLRDNRLSIREMVHLLSLLTQDKRRGTVVYSKLEEIFETMLQSNDKDLEYWKDSDNDDNWASKGTMAEFLDQIGCPAEVKNLKKLILMVESFEKDIGMNASLTDEGFTLPLGPNLRVGMKFFVS
jgi:Ca2+-binding EF-hand superfamily protein